MGEETAQLLLRPSRIELEEFIQKIVLKWTFFHDAGVGKICTVIGSDIMGQRALQVSRVIHKRPS